MTLWRVAVMREVKNMYNDKSEVLKEKLSQFTKGECCHPALFKTESETVNLTHRCPSVELALPSNSKQQMLHKSIGDHTD